MVFPVSDPFDTKEQKQFRAHCHTALQKAFMHRKTFIESCEERPELCELSDSERRTAFGVRALLGISLSVESRLPSSSAEDFLQNHKPSSTRQASDPMAEMLSVWPDFDLDAYVHRGVQSQEYIEEFSKDYEMVREISFEFRKLRQNLSLSQDVAPIFQSFQQALFAGIEATDMYVRMQEGIKDAVSRQYNMTPETVF